MKILIVDDEEKILEIIDAYLVANHYSVYKAISGAMALEKFEKNNPDLVVLDLMLPDTDGLTVCRKIREVSNVPIIMLTAKSDEDDILTGLKLGADDYMIKPFSPKELVARIQMFAAVAMSFSSVSVLLNALRLRRFKPAVV